MSLFGPPNIAKLTRKQNVAGLIKALEWQQPPDDIRADAAHALGQLGDPQAVMPLAMALHDYLPAVRRAAAEALVQIPDERAIRYLVPTLSDDSIFVRMPAAEALIKIGPPAVQPVIDALLDVGDCSPYTRQMAASVLGRLHDPRAVQPLITAVGKDRDADTRMFAAEALGQLNDPAAVAPLIAALTDSNLDVREAAEQSLRRFDDPRAAQALTQLSTQA